MHRRKILAAILAASFLLTSCSLLDQGSGGRSRSGRNRDDDDNNNGFTRPTQETEDTDETAALVDNPYELPDEYASILADMAPQIEEFEDVYHSYRCPSINYMDITGDGFPELIFKYVSEPHYVGLAIYSYNPSTERTYELYNDVIETDFGSWSLSFDAVVLDDGHLLLSNFCGSGGEYYQQMFELALGNDGYGVINRWELQELIADDDHGENGYTIIPGDATLNDEVAHADGFYSAQADYLSRIAYPVMPYSSRLYYDDYTVRDIYDRDFNSIPGSVFAEGNYLFLSELVELSGVLIPGVNGAGTASFSSDDYVDCYLTLLDMYSIQVTQIEDCPGQSFPTIAFCDITGDRIPEMFVTYATDSGYGGPTDPNSYQNASTDIVTYDPDTHSYRDLFTINDSVWFAESGMFTDIIQLDGGNILIVQEYGSLEGWYWGATEYEYDGTNLVPVNAFHYESEIIDWDTEEYEYTYYIEDDEVAQEFFDQNYYGYMSLGVCALTRCPWYSEGSDNGEWGDYMLSLPGDNVYYLLEARAYLNGL